MFRRFDISYHLFTMPSRRRRNNRRTTGQNGFMKTYQPLENSPTSAIRLVYPVSTVTSSGLSITWSNLATAGLSLGFVARISSIEIEAVQSSTTLANNGSLTVSLNDYSGTTKIVTRPLLVGPNPVRFKVRMPRSTDFGLPQGSSDAVTWGSTSTGGVTVAAVFNIAVKSL